MSPHSLRIYEHTIFVSSPVHWPFGLFCLLRFTFHSKTAFEIIPQAWRVLGLGPRGAHLRFTNELDVTPSSIQGPLQCKTLRMRNMFSASCPRRQSDCAYIASDPSCCTVFHFLRLPGIYGPHTFESSQWRKSPIRGHSIALQFGFRYLWDFGLDRCESAECRCWPAV